MSPPRRAALAFIFVTVVLDVLALGMVIPVLPKLVEDFVQHDTAKAAEIFGLFGTVFALMHFVFAPVLGALSDRFGRRPVVLISNFGLGLDYVLMALAPNLTWLLVGRVICGITSASYGAAGAYIADVTPAEKRAASFGMLGAAFGLGFVLGPAVGGLLGGVDPRLPFWVAAALSLLNGLYGLLVLPESLSPEHRAAFSWRRANPVGSLSLLRKSPRLLGLATVNFLRNLAHVVLPATFVLYGSYRYGWDERTVGLTLAAVGVSSLVVQGALVRPVVARLGERRTMLIGLAFGAAAFLLQGLAPTSELFWAAIPLTGLWGLSGPALQGMMTRELGPTEQGRLQGANASLMGIGELIGPGLFSMTFAYFISSGTRWHLPGAAFLLGAVLLGAAWIVGFRVTAGHKRAAVAAPQSPA